MPNRFLPLSADASLEEAIRIQNTNFAQLDAEAVTKVFKGPSGKNGVITGKLPYDGGYGILIYDQNGVPSIVIGIMPDGTVDAVFAKTGENVLNVFS